MAYRMPETNPLPPIPLSEINTPALIDLVSADIQEKVLAGEWELLQGYDPERPVIRDVKTKKLQKGSGKYPRAPRFQDISPKYSYKRTKTYREALESLIPIFPDKDAAHSFNELVERFFEAISNDERAARCEHPGCSLKHLWIPNVDPGAIFKMIENLAGKAVESKKIEIENTVDITEYRTYDVTIHGISLDAAAARKQDLLDSGIIDAEYAESFSLPGLEPTLLEEAAIAEEVIINESDG